jgi:hypothetical protein
MSVRTDLVKEVLVEDLFAAAAGRAAAPAPHAESALARFGHQRVARLGYEARAVEWERFEPARAPIAWLALAVREHGGDGPAACAELAEREPATRPRRDDPDAVTWRVPGPGGHVRHFLAVRAAREAPALDMATVKRCWTYGFLVRCCEEAMSPKAEPGREPGR